MPSQKLSRKKSAQSISPQTGVARPPIVAVLGHIDHGKTTLLDRILQTNLAAAETGGITQHIGAYQVAVKVSDQETKKITFIDTPGHAAFSKMRSRGAKVADLVVLVVAADEGFKPQTKESLEHIQAAKIPYLVAINKIDLPDIHLDQVKKDLAKHGILVEGYGGEIVAVPVSAKTGQGVDELLEMILLLAEMAGLEADPQGELEAVIIESKLDKARGPVATVLVRNGSLKVGDQLVVEEAEAKIRAMFDERGQKVALAGPGEPVLVLGFKKVPPVGGRVKKGAAAEKTSQQEAAVISPTSAERAVSPTETEEPKLKIILKADASGTLEAILASLPENLEVIASQTGEVNESDVLLASTTGAEIIGFRVKVPKRIEKLAETEKVKIKTYPLIYELLEAVEETVLKLLEPTIDEEILGQAKIVAEFEIKKQRIAGCQVLEGKIEKKAPLHLKRGDKIIGHCRIESMKQGKEDINQAKKGEEFGVLLKPPVDFKIGDVLVSYRSKTKE